MPRPPQKRILTGMRTTGAAHLGHYAGALRNWVDMQGEYECYFLLADVQAFSTHFDDPQRIVESVHEMVLDWLAVDFRDGGGSLKALHRQILTSTTYRQSSSPDAKGSRVDSDNRFLWRMNRRRLDAEAVRDAVLAAGGQLDLEMGGPSAEHFYFKDDHSPVYDYARFDVTSPAARRRSVYRFLVRSVQDPFMESLDCADPSLLVPRRNSTLTAVQALALLNDPLIIEQSRRFAGRLRSAGSNLASQIDDAVRIALGRAASEREIAALASHARNTGLGSPVRLC